jgi:5-methylcytosine-specific restriction protein A
MPGIRYYFDTRYRRHFSNKRRKLIRREREGAFHGKGVRNRAKDNLIERDGQICQFCKEPFERELLTIDHVFPLFMGGDSELLNLQLLCRPCHDEKCRMDDAKYLPGYSS